MMYSSGMMDGWMMFGGWGLSHWLMFALVIALIAYPLGLILRKLGFSPLWSIIAFVPLINIVALWVVALSDAPSQNAK